MKQYNFKYRLTYAIDNVLHKIDFFDCNRYDVLITNTYDPFGTIDFKFTERNYG